MKQKLSFMLCCIILSIFIWGCGAKTTSTDLPHTVSSITQTPTQMPTVMPTQIPTVTPTVKLTKTLKEAFIGVLQNNVKVNQKAYKGSYDEGTTYQPFYLNELVGKIGFEKSWNPNEFTILDMDGDKIPEIVIEIDVGGDGIFEVLHYYKSKVYGYYFVYRAMELIKIDGTHIGSSGAMDNDILKLSFSGSNLIWLTLASSESTDKVDNSGEPLINYFIANKPVTESEFLSMFEKQYAKTDATWYKFNTSNIEKYLKVN